MVDTNEESIEILVQEQSDQSIATIVPAGQSTENAVLDEIRRMGDTFSSELKSVSERVDRLAETVFKSPAPKRKRTAEPTTSSRSAWHERRDSNLSAPLPSFHDSDDESTVGDRETELSENSKSLIKSGFTSSLHNSERRKIRAQYPHSGLPQTRCPKLDAVFKSATGKAETKTTDAELVKIQAFVLDPVGPLLHLLEKCQDKEASAEMSTDEVVKDLQDTLRLIGNASSQSKPRVLLEPVPSPKEGWGYEASDKPEEPQRVCGPTTLQDGRDPHAEGLITKRRLDNEDRSEGRLLHDPDPLNEQVGTSFLNPRATAPLQVLLPAIQLVVCSMGFYQDPEAGTNPTQRVGYKTSGIHRRYTRLDGDGGDREESYLSVNIPAGKPGLHSTPSKNRDNPIPGDRIPGNDGGIQSNGITAAGSEVEKTSFRGCKDQGSISHTLSPRSVTPFRQVQLGDKSSSTESPVLQSNTERSGNSSREEQPELQCSMPAIPSIQRGVRLVDAPASTLEREESGNDTTRPSYRIRCLPHKVGSVLRGDTHGRPVVHKGKMSPHKLPRAASGDAGSQNLPEKSGKQTRPVIVGQYNSSGVCKQPGRDSLRPGNEISQRAMDVVPRTSDSPDLPGKNNVRANTESRQMKDHSDWMLNPSIFHSIVGTFPYLEVNLFATRLTSQLPRFFSWRPDPLAEATDAFLQDWSRIQGYANPPWNLVGRVLAKVQNQAADLILVAPIWPSQPWYPNLLGLLSATPLRIESQEEEIVQMADQNLEVTPPLAVWPISGNTTQVKDFQARL